MADNVIKSSRPPYQGENGQVNQTFDCNEGICPWIQQVSSGSSNLPCRLKTFRDPNLPTLVKEKPKLSSRRWWVLGASFISMTIASGFPYSLSILHVEFLAEFGRSNAETVMITSFCAGTLTTLGCIYGSIISKYGPRKVGIVGACQFSLGIGVSYFATNIGTLTGTLGILAGSGISGAFMACMASVAEHFDGKAKLSAASFLAFGTGFSTMVLPLIIDSLIIAYGWRGCLLIMSGIALNLIPCLAICKSRPTLKDGNGKHLNITAESVHQRKACQNFLSEVKELLRNQIYVVFTIAVFLTVGVLNSIIAILADFIMSNGFSREDAVILYLYMNIVGTSFRLIPGFFKRLSHVSLFSIMIVHTSVGLLSCICFPFAVSYFEFVTLMCTFGFAHGGILSTVYMAAVKILEAKNYSTGFGITIALGGLSSIMITPVIGLLRDITGTYHMGFNVAGGFVGIGLVLFCIALFLRKTIGLATDNHVIHNTSIKRSIFASWKGSVDFKY